MHRLLVHRWILFDVAVAVGLIVVTAQELGAGEDGSWAGFAVPMVAALLIRRRYPTLAVIVAGVTALLHHLNPEVAISPIDLAVPLTVYTLASAGRHGRRRMVTGLALGLVCVSLVSAAQVVALSNQGPDVSRNEMAFLTPEERAELLRRRVQANGEPLPDYARPPLLPAIDVEGIALGRPQLSDLIGTAVARALSVLLVIALAFAIGDGVRSRRAHLTTLEKRAADLEREQHQRVALSLAAERARITRELHDVVAHALSVMVVQAQGGAAALRRHPERTETALQNVIATGRTSLSEMRRLLDLVRQDRSGDPEHRPQPGVDALPELIDGVRAAGTPVDFTVEGDPVPLPLTVDLSAYRIVQEALTNTIKHSGGTGVSARVRIAYRPNEIALEITDNGRGSGTQVIEGNGLRGIAERVAVLGGELSVGPLQISGGFRVHAMLPLRPNGLQA